MFLKIRILLAGITVLVVLTVVSCSEYRKVVKSTDIQLKYQTAVKLYEKEDYHRAMQLFDELMIYYRGTDTIEKINYYYAYCYFGDDDYLQAGYYFSKFTTTFPTSKYAEECMYMAAYCQYLYSPTHTLDQTITLDAIKGLQMFINMYPKSSRVEQCNKNIDELRAKLEKKSYEIAKLYYKTENYQASSISFKSLLKDFPDTKYREQAYFYILASQYNYALNSIETKKKERLEAAKDAYNALMTTYPQTVYEKEAKDILKNIEKELLAINTQETKTANKKNNKQ